MQTPPPAFPLRRSTPEPWRPMTDAEWATLLPCLRRSGRGRPPRDLRRTWDGIFWVACSRGPWSAMPAEFGRPDTAHRTLRRAAEARRLHVMLFSVSDHPINAGGEFRSLEWRIVRTFRRAFRVATRAIAFATRLGLASALPAHPWWLPKPHLSERLKTYVAIARAMKPNIPLAWMRWVGTYARIVGGDPRRWRTTE